MIKSDIYIFDLMDFIKYIEDVKTNIRNLTKHVNENYLEDSQEGSSILPKSTIFIDFLLPFYR